MFMRYNSKPSHRNHKSCDNMENYEASTILVGFASFIGQVAFP